MIVKKKILFLILIPAAVGEYIFGMEAVGDRPRTPSPGLLGAALARYEQKEQETRKKLMRERINLMQEIAQVGQDVERGLSLSEILKNIRKDNEHAYIFDIIIAVRKIKMAEQGAKKPRKTVKPLIEPASECLQNNSRKQTLECQFASDD